MADADRQQITLISYKARQGLKLPDPAPGLLFVEADVLEKTVVLVGGRGSAHMSLLFMLAASEAAAVDGFFHRFN